MKILQLNDLTAHWTSLSNLHKQQSHVFRPWDHQNVFSVIHPMSKKSRSHSNPEKTSYIYMRYISISYMTVFWIYIFDFIFCIQNILLCVVFGLKGSVYRWMVVGSIVYRLGHHQGHIMTVTSQQCQNTPKANNRMRQSFSKTSNHQPIKKLKNITQNILHCTH